MNKNKNMNYIRNNNQNMNKIMNSIKNYEPDDSQTVPAPLRRYVTVSELR